MRPLPEPQGNAAHQPSIWCGTAVLLPSSTCWISTRRTRVVTFGTPVRFEPWDHSRNRKEMPRIKLSSVAARQCSYSAIIAEFQYDVVSVATQYKPLHHTWNRKETLYINLSSIKEMVDYCWRRNIDFSIVNFNFVVVVSFPVICLLKKWWEKKLIINQQTRTWS